MHMFELRLTGDVWLVSNIGITI